MKAVCPGDCTGSDQVTVSDILTGVNIILGTESLSSCSAFDINGDGRVTVNELLAGVLSALNGCPAS